MQLMNGTTTTTAAIEETPNSILYSVYSIVILLHHTVSHTKLTSKHINMAYFVARNATYLSIQSRELAEDGGDPPFSVALQMLQNKPCQHAQTNLTKHRPFILYFSIFRLNFASR